MIRQSYSNDSLTTCYEICQGSVIEVVLQLRRQKTECVIASVAKQSLNQTQVIG